jgi:hypothetical protein
MRSLYATESLEGTIATRSLKLLYRVAEVRSFAVKQYEVTGGSLEELRHQGEREE